MKKQVLFSFSAALLLFMGWCSSDDLNNESTPDSPAKTNRLSAAKFAGDGAYDVLGHGFNATGEYANANSAGFKVIDIDRFKSEQAARLLSENTNTQQYLEEYGENAFPGNGTALADAQHKIKLLEKENRYLQEELELLKKFRVFLKRSK